jgi:hypothetical protein
MQAGETFRRGYGHHFWVVVSDPESDPEHVLIVNVTSDRGFGTDAACLLNPGDHAFVKHASYLRYSDSKIVSVSALNRQLAAGQIILEEAVSEAVLARIRHGAAVSDFIPLENRQLLEDQGLLPIDDDNGA